MGAADSNPPAISAETTETRIIVGFPLRKARRSFFRPQSDLRGLLVKIDNDRLPNRKKVVNIDRHDDRVPSKEPRALASGAESIGAFGQ